MQPHTPHIPLLIRASLLGTALLLLSCTKTEVRQADGSDAITFTNIGTKAPVESKDDIKSFSVWGWYADDAAGNPSVVFDNTKVYEKDAAWTYDGLQFWQSGKTYDFYALYPDTATLTTPDQSGKKAAESAAYDAAGNLTVTGFDSTSGHDLMTASCTDMPGSDPQPVAFTFSHMLSKVSIIGKVQGGSATVTSAMLTDLIVVGNYNKSWSNSNTSNTSVSNDSDTELSALGANVFGKDMLLVPQSTNAVKFSIEYNTDTETGKTETFSLSFSEIPNWEPGKSYRYTFTIIGDYIVFDDPTVRGWNDAVGGNVVIDVTQP